MCAAAAKQRKQNRQIEHPTRAAPPTSLYHERDLEYGSFCTSSVWKRSRCSIRLGIGSFSSLPFTPTVGTISVAVLSDASWHTQAALTEQTKKELHGELAQMHQNRTHMSRVHW